MSVMDFAALPPEVNSGRMYAGAGVGPMVAAAAAWDGLAAQLSSAASAYQSVVAELADGSWQGPASAAMAAAAAQYVEWMHTTAAQAERTASQAKAAAAAYEQAFAATVPPPVVAANRALLASLVATNILGQNTPAIAANQAEYGEMWAQDAAAMYGYAGSSAAATALTPFAAPPQNTNPAGQGAQAAAAAQAAGTSAATNTQAALSAVPNALQSVAAGTSSDPLQWLIQLLNTPLFSSANTIAGSWGLSALFNPGGEVFTTAGVQFLFYLATQAAAGVNGTALAPLVSAVPEAALGSTLAGSYASGVGASGSAGLGGAGVSAGLGRAAALGGLSVPQAWGASAPEIRLAATALPAAGLGGAPQAGIAGPAWVGGMPPMAGMVNAPSTGDPRLRSGPRPKGISARARTSGVGQGKPSRGAASVTSALSEHELRELSILRTAVAELAKQRDKAARLIREEIRSGA